MQLTRKLTAVLGVNLCFVLAGLYYLSHPESVLIGRIYFVLGLALTAGVPVWQALRPRKVGTLSENEAANLGRLVARIGRYWGDFLPVNIGLLEIKEYDLARRDDLSKRGGVHDGGASPDAAGGGVRHSLGQHLRAGPGALVIVGEPGVGKTCALVLLLQELLASAATTYQRIPVILPARWWRDEDRDIEAWLVKGLMTRYGVPARWAVEWVRAERFAVLIDGLDELGPEKRRTEFVATLNGFIAYHRNPVVVACRTEEYVELEQPVVPGRVIAIGPMNVGVVAEYFGQASAETRDTLGALRHVEGWQGVLASRLWTFLLLECYRPGQRRHLRRGRDVGDMRRAILRDYRDVIAERMAAVNGSTSNQVLAQLQWLAEYVARNDEPWIRVDGLVAGALGKGWARGAYSVAVRLYGGGVGAVATGALALALRVLLPPGWVSGALWLLLSLAGGVAGALAAGTAAGAITLVAGLLTIIALRGLVPWLGEVASLSLGTVVSGLLMGCYAAAARGASDGKLSRLAVFGRLVAGVTSGVSVAWIVGRLGRVVGTGQSPLSDLTCFVCGVLWVASSGVALVACSRAFTGAQFGLVWRRFGMPPPHRDEILCREQDKGTRNLARVTTAALGGVMVGGVMSLCVGWMIGAELGFGLAFLFAFHAFWEPAHAVDSRVSSNEGMRRTSAAAARAALATGAVLAGCGYMMSRTTGSSVDQASVTVSLFVFGAGASGMTLGGFDLGQHALLRLMLWMSAGVPLRLGRVLDAGAKSGIFRRIGGGYSFVHQRVADFCQTHAAAGEQGEAVRLAD
jgi:hypothetical protein